jgi:hypothetical protein
MRVLALKELREVLGITAAALACYLALVASLMGAKVFDWVPSMPHGTSEVPFTGMDFLTLFELVSVLFAIALGFRQSAVEAARGTFLFLLHRPLSRERIFLIKLAVGIGLLLGCASMPIVLYGTWAAMPGHHPGPFDWSMTGLAWHMTLLTPLVYLGAFLSGLRPARWFGTRLLPLLAALLLQITMLTEPWLRVRVPLALLLYGLMVSTICYVARTRDYA